MTAPILKLPRFTLSRPLTVANVNSKQLTSFFPKATHQSLCGLARHLRPAALLG